ncbi:hypothetical protein C943_02129 [Mariniradius saccharolyticus AK6]|uniref:Uncharacterized protein n=1 Tax=Mariniradius saccharolyticus AK6 TaxID=1239962 RepID=M7X947_9BACT|nr:hypothetical protein C943_02129 [Mariniradius saccharolyticus AK6]
MILKRNDLNIAVFEKQTKINSIFCLFLNKKFIILNYWQNKSIFIDRLIKK